MPIVRRNAEYASQFETLRAARALSGPRTLLWVLEHAGGGVGRSVEELFRLWTAELEDSRQPRACRRRPLLPGRPKCGDRECVQLLRRASARCRESVLAGRRHLQPAHQGVEYVARGHVD